MRTVKHIIIFTFCLAVVGYCADPAPLPTEITLTNGTHLHQVQAAKWYRETVVLKHVAGIDRIRYENIALPERTAFEAARDAALAKPTEPTNKDPDENPAPITIAGSVFIQTQGFGAQKQGDVPILVFAGDVATDFETSSMVVHLPKPLLQTRTDADGKYEIKMPNKGPYFIYSALTRGVGAHSEFHEWRISTADVADPGHLNLANSNEYDWWNKGRVEVKIDE